MNLLKIFLGFWILIFGFTALAVAAPATRIKDIGHVLGVRDNQIMGFGLVVGLRNSGDSQTTGFTKQAMTNLLSKMGVTPQIDFKSRNVAAVMVTANLPAFVKSGQKIDVTVSSMGDASSLSGGTLLLTPLQGPDNSVYAAAQGNITVDQDLLVPNLPPIRRSQATAGRIPGGALVEKEVPVALNNGGQLSIVLDNPDFTTANRVASAISSAGFDAKTVDAGTINVTVYGTDDAINVMSRIENLTVIPDSIAKVIINERTGTVVMGEQVKISATAVSFGGINVTVGPVSLYSEGSADDTSSSSSMRTQTKASVKRNESMLKLVPQAAKLADVVRALNIVKAGPQELIAILQAMKKVGALKADLEII